MAKRQEITKKQGEAEVKQRPMAAGSETMKKWPQLVAQAWADEKLKERLLDNPKGVLREQGIEVPDGVEIRVVEPTDKLLYFMLPPKPAGDVTELTSSQLRGVAGGVKYMEFKLKDVIISSTISEETPESTSGCFCVMY